MTFNDRCALLQKRCFMKPTTKIRRGFLVEGASNNSVVVDEGYFQCYQCLYTVFGKILVASFFFPDTVYIRKRGRPRGRDLPDIHRDTYLSLQRECVTKSSSTCAFSHLSLCVLFITTITLAVNSDADRH